MSGVYKDFVDKIGDYFRREGRVFSWRQDITPYRVLVSEIMLQQTQTDRVVPYFHRWLQTFPDMRTLANAPLAQVLSAWQGLGYNRRAKFLWQTAGRVVRDFAGVLPDDPAILQQFDGIGPNTAGSLCAFAYNKPVVFIETNIRSVYIHEFFQHRVDKVHDKELLPLIEATLDRQSPRLWYYALMDYGVHIKKTHSNPNIKSLHYARQSRFQGSDRQIRGAIIRALTQEALLSYPDLYERLPFAIPPRIDSQVDALAQEGLVRVTADQLLTLG